jgi:hypothetical protein
MSRLTEPAVSDVSGWARPAVLGPLFALVSAAAGMMPAFSRAANLLVLSVGAVLCWLGFFVEPSTYRPLTTLPAGAALWAVPLLVFCGTEAVTYLIGAANPGAVYAYPTLSLLAAPVLEPYLIRAVLFFGWLAVFWRLTRLAGPATRAAGESISK